MDIARVSSQVLRRQLLNRTFLRPRANLQLPRLQIQPTFRTRPSPAVQSRSLHQQARRRPVVFRPQSKCTRSSRRWKSDDGSLDKPDSQLSLSQRLKKMSREYGWMALYVYLTLSVLDFPFCFAAVRILGTDVIGHWEHVIVSNVKALLSWPLGATGHEEIAEAIDKAVEATGVQDGQRILDEGGEGYTVEDHGYKDAQKAASGKDASLATQLALAYAIHKSFIFIRVPLTAAILPKVVKTLRGWGWNIGRPTRKALKSSNPTGNTGVNTKGTGVKPDN